MYGRAPPLFGRIARYAAPAFAAGSALFRSSRCGTTLNATSCEAVRPVGVSVTISFTDVRPAVVGVPVIAPDAGSSVSPAGSAVPGSTDQAYVCLAPVAWAERWSGTPTSATPATGAICSFGTTDIAYVCVSVRLPSVAVTLKL